MNRATEFCDNTIAETSERRTTGSAKARHRDEGAAMKSRYVMFAAYNRWANERLYGAAAAFPGDDNRADHGAFFKSTHGTLNQLLVGDRVWTQRLTGTGDAPNRLDAC
jgi:uncharacterized damage-inducible protein DinB